MSRHEREPTDYELSPSAEVLARRFIQRWDIHTVQSHSGSGYYTLYESLHVGHLFAHLRGEVTLGTYLLNAESNGRFLVLDADNSYQWDQLIHLCKHLHEQAIPSYLEQSRRGGHLWFFLEKWTSGKRIRDFGKGLLYAHQIQEVEIYPKQDELKKGPGSLIRLPFGIHRRSHRRYGFVTVDGEPMADTIREQLRFLSTPQVVPKSAFQDFVKQAPKKTAKERNLGLSVPKRTDFAGNGELPLSEQIKVSVSVRDFVGNFVSLSASGTGLCPFHDDHNPSFSVNDEENYWHCFTCGIGGSVIDFWMRYQDCDFKTAVSELTSKLL